MRDSSRTGIRLLASLGLLLGACSGSKAGGDGGGAQAGNAGVMVTSAGSAGITGTLGTAGKLGSADSMSSAGNKASTGGMGLAGKMGFAGSMGSSGTTGAAGTTAAAGTTGAAGSGAASTGCGSATTLQNGRASIDVSGMTREYVLQLPNAYDSNHLYKLIFGFHWRGGTANDVVSGNIIGGPYYGLQSRSAGSAILVAPEGLNMGWANMGGQDIAFVKAMLALFESKLCIDAQRIFSVGFSFGGMMSDEIGTEMADVFRAIAPMSGACYSGGCQQSNNNPIAVWMSHGNNDNVVPLADGMTALSKFLKKNGCGSQTMPVTPDPCVQYQGCMTGYPVVFCEFSGGHMPATFAPDAVWSFFNQF